MKRFELQIGVFIDAKDIDEMWEKFREAGLHDILNQIDSTDCYDAEVVDWYDLRHEEKSELN